VSARSYMSIGDVLTLLRQEFPDVTISKIRFLESQGLVNPERTPSGYRKFYEHDVERLRWVLRQQREHFLPLKVIKDRLEDDPSGSQAETASPRVAAAAVATDEPPSDGRRHPEADAGPTRPVLVGQHAAAERRAGSTLPGIESAATSVGGGRSATLGGRDGPSSSATRSTPGAATMARPPAAGSSDPHGPAGSAPVASAARRSRPAGDDTQPSRRAKPPAAAPGAPAPAGDGPPAANGVTESSRPPSKAAPPPEPDGGPSLSVDELASACGLDVAVVRELEEFGLVAATNVAGVESFGENALAVGQLAAQFARFGIEPRHLRMYKNAADREAGFVEQIVLPLVRQRNPDARARAHEAADELAILGQQLRSSLLRSALGNLLDG
jgi:DNA-binding transcriptional MerR regulator